jgi:hypothetical protein
MVSVLTGSGCGAGCFASVLLHPEVIKTVADHNETKKMIAGLFRLAIG